jgi:hypothetical protein
MRTFAGSEEVIRFEPTCYGDEEMVEQATEYTAYVFWRKNKGYRLLSDAIKSALICRHGFLKVYWDESHVEEEERYEGLSETQLEAMKADPDVEIVEVEEVQAVGVDATQIAIQDATGA